jgi:hypothetical protein
MTKLIFETKFHDGDKLIESVPANLIQFDALNDLSHTIQSSIKASKSLEEYTLNLWKATKKPRRL